MGSLRLRHVAAVRTNGSMNTLALRLSASLLPLLALAAAPAPQRVTPMTPDVVEWHHDEISQLPDGATLLASSPVYAHQAFRVGRHVYGLQFHIETSPEIARSWAHSDPAGVAAGPLDLDTVCRRMDAAHPDLEAVWAPFAARFADLLRAAGQRAA